MTTPKISKCRVCSRKIPKGKPKYILRKKVCLRCYNRLQSEVKQQDNPKPKPKKKSLMDIWAKKYGKKKDKIKNSRIKLDYVLED
jgi:ribosome-binding protein aMBF1 (putative translation factor)